MQRRGSSLCVGLQVLQSLGIESPGAKEMKGHECLWPTTYGHSVLGLKEGEGGVWESLNSAALGMSLMIF